MNIHEKLREQFGNQISLEEIEPNIMRIYAPFFHEDGDMFSMYIEIKNNDILIRDFGNTLMRVSYTFDIDTDNKRNVLSNIVTSNYGTIDDGELIVKSDINRLPQSIFQFSQIVSKVSNISILKREVVKSMFYDYLNDYIMQNLSRYTVAKKVAPTSDQSLIVDYLIEGKRPLFLFGVNEDTKASKVVISCLTFQKKGVPFRSVIVHENFDSLTSFYRNQITNAVDKQFTSLDQFKSEGLDYFDRELAS